MPGNRVDRPGDALERQPEFCLVVAHRAGRVDDVGRNDDEPDVGLAANGEQLVAQHVLRGVALAGVADDDEREVARVDPRRGDGEQRGADAGQLPSAVTAWTIASRHVSVRDAAHEFHMPGGPVLGVEVPAHAPDRDRRGDDGRKRQADLQATVERGGNRVAGGAHSDRDRRGAA